MSDTTRPDSIFDDFDDAQPLGNEGASSSAQSTESESSAMTLLQAELAEAQERAFRIAAELDNYRKRSRREMEESLRYAQLPVLRELLSVVDNLRRALQAAAASEQAGGLIDGVRMVSGQLDQLLKNHHCEAIASEGQPFDPNCHEALQMEPSAEHPANVVSRELQAGYKLFDRVIRPAQVFVSTGPATS